MQARVGDTITLPGRIVGQANRTGQVIEVRDSDGHPPYLVRWEDGHEGLVYPPPEAKLEHAAAR